ncbi:MAG: glycosyltransferase family 4 protein [Bacteroides stercoris]|nr:glycosyltransferase family 4 protein [Bacteroides stercoris]MDY5234898.1 glycosyltransferase family 4 protein [Bacteroides stercoris]
MMKILWISPWFGNYRIPVYENLNKLSEGNFYIICSKENTSELVREKLKRTLGDHAIIMSGEKRMTMGNETSDFANSALVIKKQPGLYKAIKSVNADVIITEGFGGWAPTGIRYAVTHRKKLCMFYERTAYVERNSPTWRSMYRRVIGIPVDHFLINGTLTEEYLNNGLHFKNTPKVKGCMCADSFGLSNAVAKVTNKDKQTLRDELKLKQGLTFLFVGQLVDRKGIKELLAVWHKHISQYPDDNLLVIGKGILEHALKEKYTSDSIHILGGINYDELYKYYALCDVFIMPTLEDNWCLVIPEAMACGKPVACSIYNGGHYELVQDGVNGYKLDPLEPDSIIRTLAKFHQADLQSMGKKSIEIESDFTPDKAAQRIFNACQKVFKK